MPKVKALNRNGEITWCTAKAPGSGNCNHVFHKTKDISDEQFQKEVDNYNEKMTKLFNSKLWSDRLRCARQGYGLEKLVNDNDSEVRAEVARQGYGHDILVHDENNSVRYVVALNSYKYDDILVNDKHHLVRAVVASR